MNPVFLAVVALFPLLAVFGTGRLFPMKQEPPKPYQPPGYVFGIVWTILTLMVGVSTALVMHTTNRVGLTFFLAAALVSLWCLWVAVYQKVPKVASLAILVASCVAAAAHACSVAMVRPVKHLSWVLLLSVAWLTFASSLSLP